MNDDPSVPAEVRAIYCSTGNHVPVMDNIEFVARSVNVDFCLTIKTGVSRGICYCKYCKCLYLQE